MTLSPKNPHITNLDIVSEIVVKITSLVLSFFCLIYFFNFYFILLYNIVLVWPYIDMNPPRVYMCSQSWTPLPPPTPYHLSGSSLCTSPKHPVSCIEHRLMLRFYMIVYMFRCRSPKSSLNMTTLNSCVRGIMWWLSFCVWLISLSIIFSRFIYGWVCTQGC